LSGTSGTSGSSGSSGTNGSSGTSGSSGSSGTNGSSGQSVSITGGYGELLTSDGNGGVDSQPNLIYTTGNTHNVLTINDSYIRVVTRSFGGIESGTTRVVDAFHVSSGCSAIFEYCVESVFPSVSIGRKRMGQIFATWDSTESVYTDVSSPDLKGSTQGFQLKVQVQGNTVFLNAEVTDNNVWNVLISTRIIF
jgi:hypothetical protein